MAVSQGKPIDANAVVVEIHDSQHVLDGYFAGFTRLGGEELPSMASCGVVFFHSSIRLSNALTITCKWESVMLIFVLGSSKPNDAKAWSAMRWSLTASQTPGLVRSKISQVVQDIQSSSR
jgi:hypothetical protein